MKSIALLAAASLFALNSAFAHDLSPEEKKQGWKSLFDGHSTAGWRAFRKKEAPDKGWIVRNHLLTKQAGVKGGDIITENTYEDFEFSWEWMLPAGANNGVKYMIIEERGQAIGHEYQMIDDTKEKDAERMTASFYDVLPPETKGAMKAPGQWNQSKILVKGNHVEHWLNGKKVLEYELGSEKVLAAVQDSKFKPVEGFGKKVKGHILLTDHNDEANYRNLKIRELK